MTLNSLKLIFYSLFNRVYAYTPHWATSPSDPDPDKSGLEGCAEACAGKEGLVIYKGQACVCTPKNTGQSGEVGWAADTNNILNVLLKSLNFISNVGTLACILSLVWGAIQLAISDGQQQKKTKAQDRIKISLIGLALFGGLKGILILIVGFFR